MSPILPLLLLGMPTSSAALEEAGVTAADRVVLQDGSILLGQVLLTRETRVEVVVRRSWAEKHLPDRFPEWEARDRQARERGRSDRIHRLQRWRDERRAPTAGPDPIGKWLELQLQRLDGQVEGVSSPLMIISIDRRDVSQVDQHPEDSRRMLRQGWRAGFEDVESMPIDRLRAGLQARGFALSNIDLAPIDDLLPPPVESDRRWLARRASTEVLNDPDLQLIRFGNLVMPDPGSGAADNQAQLAGVVGNLVGDLLGASPATDPIIPHLQRIEASGRVGVVVTGLEISPGLDRVAVESMLLVCTGPSRWERAAWRRAEVQPSDLPVDAGQDLAQDPQVQAAFRLLEGLGTDGADPRMKRLGLAVGAATQQSLSQARSALDADLQAAALRLDRLDDPEPTESSPR
jgi:hypothetical protein